MSKSYRKTPIMGIACQNSSAQKKFRSDENRAQRRKVNQLLDTEQYDRLPHPKEYGNEWSSPRDGRCYVGDYKYDPEWSDDYDKWMRK